MLRVEHAILDPRAMKAEIERRSARVHAAVTFPNTWFTANRIAWTGYAAVSCFFVLSGFVLAHTYLTRPHGFR